MPKRYADLLPEDTILRHVKPKDRITHPDTGEVIGISLEAFRRIETEEGLSVTSADFFKSDDFVERVHCAARAIRNTHRGVKPSSLFAYGRVEAIKAVCHNRDYQTTIKSRPTAGNPAHAEARAYPCDDDLLFAELAKDAWSKYVKNGDVLPI